MKINRLLAGTLALVLIAGIVSPAYAVPFVGTPSPVLSPIFGTLINFDDQATGTVVGAQDYVAQGIASITETTGNFGPLLRLDGSQSPPNYVSTVAFDGTILIECIGLASKTGIGIANSQRGPETINIYDQNMQLLETSPVASGANVYVGFDRLGVHDIKFFEIVGEFYAIDDLQHDCEGEIVGGEFLPIDSTALLLAGIQSSTVWMLPTLAGLAGAGFYLVKFRTNKE